MVTQVSPQPRIGPSQVRGRGGSLVLVTDQLDHVVPLSGVVGLDEAVLDEVVPELRVVPSRKDGRLGLVVVVLQERFVLFTLEIGCRVGAGCGGKRSAVCPFYCNCGPNDDSHDTLRDQPVPHLEVGPGGPDLVLGLPVVVLHQHEHALSVVGGLEDSVGDQPSLEVVVGPTVVDGVVQVLVEDVGHLLEQQVSGVGRLGLDDVLLLEVVPERRKTRRDTTTCGSASRSPRTSLKPGTSTHLNLLSSQVLQT